MSLWADHPAAEDPGYVSRQLITYIGNKRALLGHIGQAVERVKRRLGKDRLRVFDVFSGSGVVSRYLKAHAELMITNDLEDYAAVVSRCYLRNRNTVDLGALAAIIRDFNARVEDVSFPLGFIEELYAPRDEAGITAGDRVFYTRENARRLDNYRRMIATVPEDLRDMLLGPLLSSASVHANTAGVFKGFYKDRSTGIGRFGGRNGDALARIKGRIELGVPVLSRFECDVQVLQEDANEAVRRVRNLDLAYVDPPYNQHPYGSNYFMLNLLVHYERPRRISRVSGIPTNWRRSGYNVRSRSLSLLRDLLRTVDSRFLLVSFNNEGFIEPHTMMALLRQIGTVEVVEMAYNAFRGSRNLRNRPIHVKEQLFLVERT
jgi:adenine-specific DNA-methyltransferase